MKINGKNFTIGADPEVFVKNKNTGKFVSAHNMVPGTKEKPHVVPSGMVQVDGLALEFGIDPADSATEFKDNLTKVQNILKGMIGDHEFIPDVSVEFDEEFANSLDPSSLLIGCEGDFNGWTLEENPTVDGSALMRTAGGHVHVGGFHTDDPWGEEHFTTCAKLARIMDQTLGVYSVLWDNDDKRRSMYGKAGSFRPKSYGMEYRTMSNQWIFSPKLIHFVFEASKRALEYMFEDGFDADNAVREIIDTSDRQSPYFRNDVFAQQVLA